MSAITDGTSNTIFFAERYAICGNTGDPNNMYTLGNLMGGLGCAVGGPRSA